jgi:DNA-binding CsgD family transcriptional regulator
MSSLAVGSVLGDFRVEGVVGRGGMGVVYHAVQLSLGRPVALKLIAPHLADDDDFRERFVRESRLSASIDHPHIVPVYVAGEEEGLHYIAMRFVEGVTLRTAITAEGRLDPGRAARLTAQVASALEAAHERGLVHRDVKPANILISRHGGEEHAYLTDFGLTKRQETEGLTGSGEWVGTLDYVAPEQLRGGEVDGRADVYSLGCVLFECLTGQVPFPRDNDLAKLWAHTSDPVPAPVYLVADLPPELSAVVVRAMEKKPADRFASAGKLGRAALAAAPAAAGPPAPPAETPPRTEPLTRQPTRGVVRQAEIGGGDRRLLEREQELEQAGVELDAAVAGSGRLFLVAGQAGIGKTSLLGEVTRLAEARGFDVFTACGMELEREYAYGVVRQLFEYRLHRLAPDERAGLFRGAAGLAESLLLGAEQPAAGAEDGHAHAPGDRVFAALHGLYWFCAGLSERTPVLLMIDDADRADLASLRFVAHLAPRLDGLPLGVAVASRPVEHGPAAEILGDVARHASLTLSPHPLSAAGSAALIRGRLGASDDELCSACHTAARGNPFLLGELCATMRAEGLEPTAAAAPMVERLAPRNIADSSLTRIELVAPEARRLVQAAALMGPGAELRQAAALAELDLASAATLADSLVELGVLASSVPLEFVHPVVRTAIVEDQPAGARALLHARAARLLADESVAGELVCAHLMQAAPAGDAWVVAQLLATARDALERAAPDAGASLLARALSEPPARDQRAEVLRELGRAEALGPDPAGAVEHLRAALELAPERDLRDDLVAELMSALWHLGRRGELLELAREELEGCGPDTPLESRRRLEADLIMGLKFNVDHYEELDERLAELAPELTGDSPPERAMLAILAQRRVERAEPVEGAVAAARLALERGLLADHAPSLRAPAGVALRALIESDEQAAASTWIAEGLELARAGGARLGLLTAHRFLAELAYRSGDLHAAEADARLVANAWLEFHSLAAFCAAATLGQTLVALGRLDEAEASLGELGEGLQYPGFPNSAVAVARGELAMALGDPAGARLHFMRAGEEFPYSGWRPGAAHASLLLGERERAIELAEEDLARARRFGAPRALGIALRVAGLARGGERGLGLLEESAEVLRGSPAALERASSLCELGAALRRGMRPADSHAPLRTAFELAHRCGAQPLAERARKELVASGGTPPAPASTGVVSLTAPERRVCQLAAEGLSNAEIAQSLLMTRLTVETHLASASRKLDVGSRAELVRALERNEEAEAMVG